MVFKTMLGIIGFSHHRVSCIIGIHPEERTQSQDIFIDIKVKTDFAASIHSGKIGDTINYAALADLCTHIARTKKHQLLEGLAHEILQEILSKFNVRWAWICIKKPLAIPSAEYALVELEQEKS